MFGIEILDVIIGLVFVYLLCSLAASAITEAISRIFDIRAKSLEKEIVKMFNEDVKTKLYNHPLIKAVTRDLKWIERKFKRPARPSYINTKLFSMALADILKLETQPIAEKPNEQGSDPTKPTKEETAVTLKTGLSVPAVDTIINSVNLEIHHIKDTVAAFQQKIENWFDTAMKEMSIWYKGKSRFIIFFIALFLCAGLNIDTVMLTKYLYQNEATRTKLVESAIEYIEKNPTAPQTKTQVPSQEAPEAVSPQPAQPENKIEPAADAMTTEPKTEPQNKPNDNPTPQEKIEKGPIQMATKLEADLQELGLPIGWHCSVTQKDDIQGKPQGFAEWFLKVIGLLLSALAISMGAPFWFDILRKMVAFRKEMTPEKKEEKTGSK